MRRLLPFSAPSAAAIALLHCVRPASARAELAFHVYFETGTPAEWSDPLKAEGLSVVIDPVAEDQA